MKNEVILIKDEEDQTTGAANLFSYLSREMGLDDTETEMEY